MLFTKCTRKNSVYSDFNWSTKRHIPRWYERTFSIYIEGDTDNEKKMLSTIAGEINDLFWCSRRKVCVSVKYNTRRNYGSHRREGLHIYVIPNDYNLDINLDFNKACLAIYGILASYGIKVEK